MALVTKQIFLYEFPEVKTEDAALFNDVMSLVFEHCKKGDLNIVNFLKGTLPVEKSSVPTIDPDRDKKVVDRFQILAGLKKIEAKDDQSNGGLFELKNKNTKAIFEVLAETAPLRNAPLSQDPEYTAAVDEIIHEPLIKSTEPDINAVLVKEEMNDWSNQFSKHVKQ